MKFQTTAHSEEEGRASNSQHHNPAINAADTVPVAGIAVTRAPTCHSSMWILLHP
jgi:hypothetical protein